MSRVNHEALKRIGRELLIAIGDDPDRPGLVETPRRFADAWREFIEYDPGTVDTTFPDEPQEPTSYIPRNDLVIASGIRVWSLCEHHLMPFWCDLAIGYMPDGRLLGASKLARIAHKAAHRLQLQEGLVRDVAAELATVTGSRNVAVVASGEHTCMVARGIKTPSIFRSSAFRGCFEGLAWQQHFLQLAGL